MQIQRGKLIIQNNWKYFSFRSKNNLRQDNLRSPFVLYAKFRDNFRIASHSAFSKRISDHIIEHPLGAKRRTMLSKVRFDVPPSPGFYFSFARHAEYKGFRSPENLSKSSDRSDFPAWKTPVCKTPGALFPALARFSLGLFFLFPLSPGLSSSPVLLLKQTCLEYPPQTLLKNFLCVKLKEAWYAYDKIMRTESIRCIKSHCINLCDPRRSCMFIFFHVANARHIHFWFIPLFYSHKYKRDDGLILPKYYSNKKIHTIFFPRDTTHKLWLTPPDTNMKFG